MSEAEVTAREARVASTLFYGLLGGFAGAASCCCWPGSVLAAWVGTRRALSRGYVAPGDGLSFGFGLGLVMALVMSSLGTAIALSSLDGPEAEALAPLMAETPLWLLALVVAAMLGAVGLGSGLMGGLLAGSARELPENPTPAATVARPDVPVPGSMTASMQPSSAAAEVPPEDAETASLGDSAPEEPQPIDSEDFVTAETAPRELPAQAPAGIDGVSDPETTVAIEPDPPTAAEELREWEGDEEAPESEAQLEDEETEGDG